jgi:lambda repressor-like predicted transcriptional regulator
MTFREKIDNILRISKKKFSSITELEAEAGLGMNTLRKAYNDNREPSRKVVGKLLENVGINPDWWEGESSSIYVEKPTPGRKEDTLDAKMSELQDRYIKVLEEKIVLLERDLERYRSGAK